jgi:hypothetical protein
MADLTPPTPKFKYFLCVSDEVRILIYNLVLQVEVPPYPYHETMPV